MAMNEFQRLSYLSSIGIESYVPRLVLPFAPKPMLCELPRTVFVSTHAESFTFPENERRLKLESSSPVIVTLEAANAILPVNSLLDNLFPNKKTIQSTLIGTHKAPAPIESVKSQLVESFSLSIVRPVDGVMIVDSRDTKLALPTELLLRNVLQTIFPSQALRLNQDILRWPMMENSFAKPNVDDARAELQTWLSVQHERQPIDFLWLMGRNASVYFLSQEVLPAEYLWCSVSLAQLNSKALILPSLNELLLRPQSKKQLYSALQLYHFSNHE
jgi:hypothetical protein